MLPCSLTFSDYSLPSNCPPCVARNVNSFGYLSETCPSTPIGCGSITRVTPTVVTAVTFSPKSSRGKVVRVEGSSGGGLLTIASDNTEAFSFCPAACNLKQCNNEEPERSIWDFMRHCTALVLLVIPALAALAQEQPSYSRGTVVRVTTQSLFEATRNRPTAQSESGPPDTGTYANVHILFIRKDSTTYVAQVLDPKQSYAAKLRKGSAVQFRTLGDDLYLKDPAGQELRLRLLERNPKGVLRKSE